MSLSDRIDATTAHCLSKADAEAFDALVEWGFDPSRVPEHLRPRAAHAARLLGLLDAARLPSHSLTDRTLAAIRNAGTEVTLCRDDALALEALADAGFDVSKVAEHHKARAALHERLASIATDTKLAQGTASDLAERTFDLVMVAADRPLASLKMEPSDTRVRSRRINFFDLVGVAAMLLLGVSVVWPVLSAVQQKQAKSGCLANINAVASAMSTYAGDHHNALPVAHASVGGTWWNVGDPQRSNSANLLTLARTGYAAAKSLACPAHARGCKAEPKPEQLDWRNVDDVSYSYQIMFTDNRPTWNGRARVVVLADRSPIVLRNLRGEAADPLENSPNHGQQGQDVLYSDGSALWMTSPEMPSGDNIWLPRQVEEFIRQWQGREPARLSGNEAPGSEHDAFLGP